MNRGAGRLQPPAPSSNYLLIFFAFSVGFLFLLPYLSPLTALFPRLGARLLTHIFFKKNTDSPPQYQSANSLAERRKSQTLELVSERPLVLDRSSETLERIVVDLQRSLQIERERMLQMEHEIRLLRMSENFLQERVRSLEERSYSQPRDATSSSSASFELLMQHTESVQRNQANLNNLVRDLSKIVQTEKDRTSSLASEVSALRKSEARLAERVKVLEEKLLLTANYERRFVFDDENKHDDGSEVHLP